MSRLAAVTGGSGFIGRALVARLVDEGWTVRALMRGPDPGRETPAVEPVPGRLEDAASLRRLVDGADLVVHCAGAVRAPRPETYHAVNAAGTARLVEAVGEVAPRCRLIAVSSLAARQPELSAYAASKRAGEQALAACPPEVTRHVLRPPAVYGPGDRATLVLFRQLARGFAVVPANGGRFSLLHVDDLAGAVARLAAGPRGEGGVVELDDCRPGGYGWTDVIAVARRSIGRPIRAIAVPRPLLALAGGVGEAFGRLVRRPPILTRGKVRELYHPDWVCRGEGAAALAGWTPCIDLEMGFALTLAWYRRQGWL